MLCKRYKILRTPHAGTAFEHKAHEQFKNFRGKLVKEMLPIDSLGAVHMSRVSPANRVDSILSRPMVA